MQKYIDTIGLFKNYKQFHTCWDTKNHHHDTISKGRLPNYGNISKLRYNNKIHNAISS